MTPTPSKTQELRTDAGITVPCPSCHASCRPDYATKLDREEKQQAVGSAVVLSRHYLELDCAACGLQLWLPLDDNGYPIEH